MKDETIKAESPVARQYEKPALTQHRDWEITTGAPQPSPTDDN